MIARALPILLVVLVACGEAAPSSPDPNPDPAPAAPTPAPGPWPLDRLASPGDPTHYKGVPLDMVDGGEPRVTPTGGVVGVVCIGMSNAAQECDEYIARLPAWRAAGEVDPAVVVVNCAVGGHAIERWIDPAFQEVLWDRCANEVLPAAGLTRTHVRVVWHKAASQFTTDADGVVLPAYPHPDSDWFRFTRSLGIVSRKILLAFPETQAVYTSSRSYGGFAPPHRGEPLSYEEGLALNEWLREHSDVDGKWFGWGPYLWAPDCATGARNGSGTCYDREDFRDDGVHPSASGRAKIAALLHARFLEHAWYRSR